MSLLDRIIKWIKSLRKSKNKNTKPKTFRLVNRAWNDNKIVYKGVLTTMKFFGVVHHLECRRLSAKESKEHWKDGLSIPTHWIEWKYLTKNSKEVPLVNKAFSFVKDGFKPDEVAVYVIGEVASRIIVIDHEPFILLNEGGKPIATHTLFRRDKEGFVSKFWEEFILKEFNLCQSSLGR